MLNGGLVSEAKGLVYAHPVFLEPLLFHNEPLQAPMLHFVEGSQLPRLFWGFLIIVIA